MGSFDHCGRRVVQVMFRPRRMALSGVVPSDRSIRHYVFVLVLAQINKSCAKRSTPLSEHLFERLHAVEFVLIRAGWLNLDSTESLRGDLFKVSGQMTLLHI